MSYTLTLPKPPSANRYRRWALHSDDRVDQRQGAQHPRKNRRRKMNDLETLVAEAHADLVAAGHGWAQVRRLTETEKLDAVKLPHEWISAQAEKTDGGKKIVRIRSLDKLAIRFASAEMMCNRLK